MFNHYFRLTCLSLAFCSSISFAGSVEVALNFDKKPAKFGIAYLYDENAPPIEGVVDQQDKQFVHGVVAVSPNTAVSFKNSDSVDHNIFVNELSKDFSLQFDIGLMPAYSEIKHQVDWDNGTLIRIGCKIHPKMKGYIANIKSKSHANFEFKKKKKDYSLSLKDASYPAQVKILLDRHEPVIATLTDANPVTVDLIKKGKKRGTATLQFSE